MSISLQNITVSYDGKSVFENYSCDFTKRICAVMGKSGCGKTTLLNVIAGLKKTDDGILTGTQDKRIACVFNEPRLLPWYSVRKNILLCCKDPQKLDDILQLTECSDFADKFPTELSAGMAQRASIARALAFEGDILLMDEPFKALDSTLKETMIKRCLGYFKGEHLIFVTHDADEAEFAEEIVKI